MLTIAVLSMQGLLATEAQDETALGVNMKGFPELYRSVGMRNVFGEDGFMYGLLKSEGSYGYESWATQAG